MLLLTISQHAQLSKDITISSNLRRYKMLDLEIHVFDLHAVGFDGSHYTGDGVNDVPGWSGDCERQGEGCDEDKGGEGQGVHL